MKFLTGLIAILIGTAHAEEIPLKEVWAYKMPGTREMTDAMREDGYVSEEGPLLLEIRRQLKRDPDKRTAVPAFVVEGTGMGAMKAAHDIFTTDVSPKDSLPEGSDVAAVFFSYEFGSYVQIERVVREGNEIRIVYRFVPHESMETTQHFAIIPLGKLHAGAYNVVVEQAPIDRKFSEQGFQPIPAKQAKGIVSRSFKFEVSAKP